jgi:large subunit ribosomal protein L10
MPKTRLQKEDIIKDMTDSLKEAKSVVLSKITGLTVAETTELRRKLREEKVKHKVIKISLLKRSLHNAGMSTDNVGVKTQVAVSLSEDETAAARILKNFGKDHENLQPLLGYLEKQQLTLEQVNALANLPTKLQLLGQFASVLSAPARGLATVLSGNLRGLVRVLSQVKK